MLPDTLAMRYGTGVLEEPLVGGRNFWTTPLWDRTIFGFRRCTAGRPFFRLTPEVTTGRGQQWLVPAEYLSGAQMSITPEIVTGYRFARFEFRDVVLADWMPTEAPGR